MGKALCTACGNAWCSGPGEVCDVCLLQAEIVANGGSDKLQRDDE